MDRFYLWIAYFIPKRVCYFIYIRVHAYATGTEYRHKTPDQITWDEAIKAWSKQ